MEFQEKLLLRFTDLYIFTILLKLVANQLTLFQVGGADYAHYITTGPLDLHTFLLPCFTLVPLVLHI
jgi:hypothetical protein